MTDPDKRKYFTFTCYPLDDCGFNVKSHDEDEVVEVFMNHSAKVHGKASSKAMAKGLIKVE